MRVSRDVRLAALSLLLVAMALPAPGSAPPESHVGGMWPVGVAAILLLDAPGTRRVLAGVLVWVLALASLVLGPYSLAVSAAYATGILAECVVAVVLLRRALGCRIEVRHDRDVVGYLAATAVAATVGAAVLGASAAVAHLDTWWHVTLMVFLFHWLSLILFLAVRVSASDHAGVQSTAERVLRWSLSIGMTVVAFVASHLPGTILLMFPVLAWGALRASFKETAWQLIVVGVLASSFTYYGYGALAGMSTPWSTGEFEAAPVSVFVLVAALTCLPFAVSVGRQRQSAVEARDNAARLDHVITSAPGIAIVELDDEGRIVLFNPEAEAITGYAEGEVLGRRLADLGTPEPMVTHTATTGSGPVRAANPQEWRPTTRSGEERIVALSLVDTRDEQDRTTGYVATFKDVTERVHAQGALASALDVQRRATAQLQEVNEAKDSFVSTVSHELRTPLTNIIGWLELLTDGPRADRSSAEVAAIEIIERNSHRLLELIDSLLLLSRVESLGDGAAPELVDLTEVVRTAVAGVAATDRVELHLPTEPVVVTGDPDQLLRVVAELCDNALRYSPADTRVSVVLSTDAPEGPAVSVSDAGIGLTAQEQDLVFNRFYRGALAESQAIQGSGLGLSVARGIARRHGGDLTASSSVGAGAVFTLTLPHPDPEDLVTPEPEPVSA